MNQERGIPGLDPNPPVDPVPEPEPNVKEEKSFVEALTDLTTAVTKMQKLLAQLISETQNNRKAGRF